MEQHRMFRVGSAVILMALLFRLFFSDIPQRVLQLVSVPEQKASITSTETGQDARFSSPIKMFFPDFQETPTPHLPEPGITTLPSFSGAASMEFFNAAKVHPDMEALLAKPLTWNLQSETPAVLILHTHATESYTRKKEPYKESSAWRTLNENYNMLAIGDRVAVLLQEAGISVIHDRTLHDRPSYDGAYVAARKTIQAQLKANPSICLVLDIHRDAAERSYGQLRTNATVDGQRTGQLMCVIGTNHEGYEENLSVALKLHAQLEQQAPGITRPLQLRTSRYNQDLSPGALIVEVGAAGNTHPEALRAADQLAFALIALAQGTN